MAEPSIPPEELEQFRVDAVAATRRAAGLDFHVEHGEPAEPEAPPDEDPERAPRIEPFPLIEPIALQGKPVPPREWLVDGLIPLRATTILGGDGGTGKTILAMQLLSAAALGKAFLGRPTLNVRGLGFLCEDEPDEMHRRQDRINAHCNVDFGDLENLKWANRVGLSSEMMFFPDAKRPVRTPVFDQLRHAALEFSARLIVLDSLYDVFGGDEINRRQVRAFCNALTGLAIEINGAVVLLAHPSLSGMASGSGSSGSTGWSNAVRSRLYLTADPEKPDARTLKVMKGNYAAPGGTIDLTWSDGVFVAAGEEPAMLKSLRKHGAEDAFLEAFRKLVSTGIELNHNRNAGTFAPAMILKAGLAQGRTRQQLEGAMLALMTAGKLRVEAAKRSGHDRQFLVETADGGSLGTP